jgi:leucyl-tRNA synthetase
MKKTRVKNLEKYQPGKIEAKWRKVWEKNKTNEVDLAKAKKPYFNLMMFPYPSAEGLHVGNMYAFTGSDIWGRYMRMKGYDVFEPIGLDGFGIHSENYALKVGKHPAEQAKISEANFYRQLRMIGNQFSWENKLETYDPDYYRWTQWIFTKMFKAGLAYRKKSGVNWCPSCKTVLADEQVIQGKCERCDSEVKEKKLAQWFFKITDYAERLLKNTEKIDWSEKVLLAQRNWIGKKSGINISYEVVDEKGRGKVPDLHVKSGTLQVVCFTTRPDTNFGATFLVLAPEHPLLDQITSKKNKKAVSSYKASALKKSKMERMAEGRSKTGVFTGAYCRNQLNGKLMPVWVSDFVLMDFGTGAVVGVPGHDLRDFEFAQKFALEIVRVVVGLDGDRSAIKKASQVQEKEGKMINSGFLNEMEIDKAQKKIMDYIETKGWGKRTVTYHLRDWLISRQRYWGPPIPMIKCSKCGWVAVPEKDLPVLLPEVKDWRPKGTGRGPLAELKDWVKVKCPQCGGKAERETDVSDTFLDSAWYFLRYPSVGNEKQAWNQKLTKKWLPVEMYIGGAEHSVLHLLYSRFICMVFKDLGLLNFEEPFCKFRAHGLIIKDGTKMSKSRGNVVNPDEYIKKYGVDALRCYLMFLGPLSSGGDFRDTGMRGMDKFLRRVYGLVKGIKRRGGKQGEKELFWEQKTIKKVTKNISKLKYNTAISSLMEYVNFLKEQKKVSLKSLKTLVLLMAPLAPFLAEELWQLLCSSRINADLNADKRRLAFSSVHDQAWPEYEEKYIREDQVEMVVQINGKLREKLKIKSSKLKIKSSIISLALKSPKVQKFLGDKKPKKTVFVKGRLINFVV